MLLDLFFDLSRIFIKNLTSILLSSIIPGMFLIILISLVIDIDEDGKTEEEKIKIIKKRKEFSEDGYGYFLHIIYTIIIVIFCFLITKYIEKKYLFLSIVLIFLMYLSIEIYTIISQDFVIKKAMIVLTLLNISVFFILYYIIIKDFIISIIISGFGLVYLFYLFFCFHSVEIFSDEGSYNFAVLFFNIAWFEITPGLIIVIPIG